MKRAAVISIAILFLLLGTTALAYAQHEQQGKEQGKPQQAQQHQQGQAAPQQHQQAAPQQHQQAAPQQHQQAAPQQRQQPTQHQQQAAKPAQRQAKPQQTYGGAYHGGVKPTGPTYGGVHQSGVPQHQGQVHSGFGQSRASSWNNDHRTWGQRGGYNGYRIPQDRFGLYFGSNHFFRIYGLPMFFVGGYPRFQYDGYWVTFVDPWPETWPDTWYETDDVYLDYTGDGYYLYNRTRPGPGIAVTIAF
jgi:hypothetical protein